MFLFAFSYYSVFTNYYKFKLTANRLRNQRRHHRTSMTTTRFTPNDEVHWQQTTRYNRRRGTTDDEVQQTMRYNERQRVRGTTRRRIRHDEGDDTTKGTTRRRIRHWQQTARYNRQRTTKGTRYDTTKGTTKGTSTVRHDKGYDDSANRYDERQRSKTRQTTCLGPLLCSFFVFI
jgi:hypothetical protein